MTSVMLIEWYRFNKSIRHIRDGECNISQFIKVKSQKPYKLTLTAANHEIKSLSAYLSETITTLYLVTGMTCQFFWYLYFHEI